MGSSRREAPKKVEIDVEAPPEDATFTVEELAAAAGVTVRTVRYYVEQHVLPAPVFRSWFTRYGRDHLLRLRAAVALRGRKMRLAAVREQLASASLEELFRLAGFKPRALPEAPKAPLEAPKARPLPAGFVGAYRSASHPSERWEHIAICPGVQLLVRSEADLEAWRVAREIVAVFAAKGDEGSAAAGPAL